MKLSKCCSKASFKDFVGNNRCSECLLCTTNKKSFRIAYIGLFLILILCGFSSKENSSVVKFQHRIVDTCDISLTDSCILQELIKDSCVLPNIAISQAKIESNYYKSYKAIHSKNLFGIKFHKCKYVLGEYNYQATYKSYKDNIACYCEIQKRYLNSIDGHYAINKDYINLIKKIN